MYIEIFVLVETETEKEAAPFADEIWAWRISEFLKRAEFFSPLKA
jgi:hypothetical protein